MVTLPPVPSAPVPLRTKFPFSRGDCWLPRAPSGNGDISAMAASPSYGNQLKRHETRLQTGLCQTWHSGCRWRSRCLPAFPAPDVLAVRAGRLVLERDTTPVTLISIAVSATGELTVSAEIVALSMTNCPPRMRAVPAASAETSRRAPLREVDVAHRHPEVGMKSTAGHFARRCHAGNVDLPAKRQQLAPGHRDSTWYGCRGFNACIWIDIFEPRIPAYEGEGLTLCHLKCAALNGDGRRIRTQESEGCHRNSRQQAK